jgi:hypothetical protein
MYLWLAPVLFFLIAYFFFDCIKKIHPEQGQMEQACNDRLACSGGAAAKILKKVRPHGGSHGA